MKIELRKLKVMESLSEETTCYSADIYVNGKPAFLASNHGHGGSDDFHAVGDVTLSEVELWLKSQRPLKKLEVDGQTMTFEHTLEDEVADLIHKDRTMKQLKRQCATMLLTIEGNQVKARGLLVKGRKYSAAEMAGLLRGKIPDFEVVNNAGPAVLSRAAELVIGTREAA